MSRLGRAQPIQPVVLNGGLVTSTGPAGNPPLPIVVVETFIDRRHMLPALGPSPQMWSLASAAVPPPPVVTQFLPLVGVGQ